ncbi:Phosphatidylethanolamine-binding protein [Plasmodiophora brassicae]|nr:hypothetical protein PBRA_004278 [Plasmodiophora brassicae]
MVEGMSAEFQKHEIVPDVVSHAPRELAEVVLPGGYGLHRFGEVIKPSQIQRPPKLHWKGDGTDQLYTLLMVDPDAPSRTNPTRREWVHWIVVNIPGADVPQGKTLLEYAPPTPPAGTGLHRYVFLIYKQDRSSSASPLPKTASRGQWSAAEFAEKNGLGNPVAGFMFQAEFETGGRH